MTYVRRNFHVQNNFRLKKHNYSIKILNKKKRISIFIIKIYNIKYFFAV